MHNVEVDLASFFVYMASTYTKKEVYGKSFFAFSYFSTRHLKGVRDIDPKLGST